MRRRTLAPHLELDQLEQRYRQASDPVSRSQWQILWLLKQGQFTKQVVQSTGYSENWICTIVQRYNTDGPLGISDRRHTLSSIACSPPAPRPFNLSKVTTRFEMRCVVKRCSRCIFARHV